MASVALLCCISTACRLVFFSFFFTTPSTTEIYTLSLHDALPISSDLSDDNGRVRASAKPRERSIVTARVPGRLFGRSEEHTSELQSPYDLVCRLLLEKKKTQNKTSVTVYNIQSKLLSAFTFFSSI